MDDFEKRMQAIFEYNRKQQTRDSKLTRIKELLPPPGHVPSLKEFISMLKSLRAILEEVGGK